MTDIKCSSMERDYDNEVKDLSLAIVNFNCNGFKGSYGGILNMMKQNDCLFLCETWLKPNELSVITKELNDLGYWCNMKSSIDPEQILTGRPYGGVGFVCRRICGITYVPLPCENDRIMAVQIVVESKVCLTMVGVYLPYHDGSASQAALYSETLEDIQCIIDSNDPSPILLLGDMNASMPKSEKLTRHWYKTLPFTKDSYLLYEFICQNDLYSCNFDFENSLNYTYHKSGCQSYIDHVFFSRFAQDKIKQCSILCPPDIVSDHLPMKTEVDLCVNLSANPKQQNVCKKIPQD